MSDYLVGEVGIEESGYPSLLGVADPINLALRSSANCAIRLPALPRLSACVR
jgi:hypothetical protein